MANVHGGNLHHPDTEAIKGRCIRTNFYHYILIYFAVYIN